MSDRYQIQGKIGQGGLGAVYKAFDTNLKREVALKRVLTPEEADAAHVQEAADKLMTEATVMSSLNHPNIVTVFDVGQDESGGFVVMELLDGETLDETIARGLLTAEDFREVVNQTLEALIAAQSVNMMHRDLKPSNVMVIWRASGKFQVKILDFGLAKVSAQPSIQTIDHGDAILGSIYFMAPEQFERRKLDFRTDLYAMGCIYYNSLTGKYPFDGESAPQVMAAHLQHKVKPLQELRPDLPPDICQWVMWLINRDMNKRPTDASDALARFPMADTSGPVPVAEIAIEASQPAMTSDGKLKVKTGTTRTVTTATSANRIKTGPQPARQTTSHQTRAQTGPVLPSTLTTGVSHVTAAQALSQDQEQQRKKKLILIGSAAVGLLLVILASVLIAGKFKRQGDENRLSVLAGNPSGGTDDVELLVSFLDSKEPANLRTQATSTLTALTGNAVDSAIVNSLRGMDSHEDGRSLILQVIGDREIGDAFEDALAIYRQSGNAAERVTALNAISSIARVYDVKNLLPLLAGKISDQDRAVVEETVIRALLADTGVDARVTPIIAAMDKASGEYRRSLARILGTLGGRKALERVESMLTGNDQNARYDAILALQNWPDRTPQGLLMQQLDSAGDATSRTVTVRALMSLLSKPSGQTIRFAESALFNKMASKIQSQNDWGQLMDLLITRPHPTTVNFINNAFKGPEGIKTQGLKLIEDKLSNAKPAEDVVFLSAATAGTLGTPGAILDRQTQAIQNWNLPGSVLAWNFQITQPGTYKVEIEAASDTPGSDYEVLSGVTHLRGKKSPDTGSEDAFKLIEAGEVVLEKPGHQLFFLMAGKIIKGDIMAVKSVRLTRTGNAGS